MGVVEASAAHTLCCRQYLAICPFWLQRKHSPLLIHCCFLLLVYVTLALVCPMSMALGLQLVSAFFHWNFVAPPRLSFPLTLSFRNIYSCWCVRAVFVQSFHVTGWSNFTQFAINLKGRALWNTSRVASLFRS